MNKIKTLSLLLIAFFQLGMRNARFDQPQTYAIIVGVSNFATKGITPLKFAHLDAYAYYQFLRSPKGGAVPEGNIKYFTNEKATRQAVIAQLRAFADQAGPEDVLVFYISTHGIADPKIKTDLYYTLYDTDPANYWGTGLLKDDILKTERSSNAKIKLFFSDACHSGGSGIYTGVKDEGSDQINALQSNISSVREPSFAILAASSKSETSAENLKWGNGHGVFTYYLIKGLEGEADKKTRYASGDNNGIVTMRELYNYLYSVVPLETGNQQHPELSCDNPDIIPLSATTPEKYTGALTKVPKTIPTEQPTGANNAPVSPVVTNPYPEFTFDGTYKTMEDGICRKPLNSNFDQVYSRCTFLNRLGEGIVMYRGICVSTNRGASRVVLNIGANRKSSTDDLLVGDSQNNGPTKPENATYKFYFITSDPGKPKRYGTISLELKACQQLLIALDKENLLMTPGGERQQSYLGYAGLN